MSIHPDCSFPLRASDQADVIRIYLELLTDNDRAARAPAVHRSWPVETKRPIESHRDFDAAWPPGEMPDHDR